MKRISASLIILISILSTGTTKALINQKTIIDNKQNNLNFSSNKQTRFKSINPSKFDINNERVINITDIKDIISSNNKELKIIESEIEETKLLLKSELSKWYPSLNLSSSGLPQYIKGNTYNELSSDTSNDQIKAVYKMGEKPPSE